MGIKKNTATAILLSTLGIIGAASLYAPLDKPQGSRKPIPERRIDKPVLEQTVIPLEARVEPTYIESDKRHEERVEVYNLQDYYQTLQRKVQHFEKEDVILDELFMPEVIRETILTGFDVENPESLINYVETFLDNGRPIEARTALQVLQEYHGDETTKQTYNNLRDSLSNLGSDVWGQNQSMRGYVPQAITFQKGADLVDGLELSLLTAVLTSNHINEYEEVVSLYELGEDARGRMRERISALLHSDRESLVKYTFDDHHNYALLVDLVNETGYQVNKQERRTLADRLIRKDINGHTYEKWTRKNDWDYTKADDLAHPERN